MRPRPTGVTIMAVLEILAGLLYALVGFSASLVVTLVGGALGAAVGGLLGGVFIVLAIIEFVIAWGLLTGKNWARWIGIIFGALGVLSGLGTLPFGIVSIVIDGVIIYYLTRPHVINWFEGRTPAMETPPPPAPPV